MNIQLPIHQILSSFVEAVNDNDLVLLEAPPGAGKTTIVPLELLNQSWNAGKKIIMLEPRRIAARSAAVRMASLLGEDVGETIGYRVRGESKVSSSTRVVVMTEGLFIRQVQNDPELEDVGAVVFDEFHERSILSDLGLGIVKDIQESLNDTLKVIIMSATLGGEELAEKLPGATLIKSEGRCYPVETIYCPPDNTRRIEENVCSVLAQAINENTQSILVFLPGVGEINAVTRLLRDKLSDSILICPLHGGLSLKEQQAAVRPAPGGLRKVVLSTPIAESSLTIDGVSVVVDVGLTRSPKFDASSGMSRLETIRISRSSADQRQGRAGRLEPGVCYRMWSRVNDSMMEDHVSPEVCRGDITSFLLELAYWGVRSCRDIFLLDYPSEQMLTYGWELLKQLGAVNNDLGITSHGREIAELGVHPRLGHMILTGKKSRQGECACDLAAIIEERDFMRNSFSADITLRLDALKSFRKKDVLSSNIDRHVLRKVAEQSLLWRKKIGASSKKTDVSNAGVLLAYAYPDRIGKARDGSRGRFVLSNGKGVFATEQDIIASAKYIVATSIGVRDKDSKVFLAAAIEQKDIYEYFSDQIVDDYSIYWDRKDECAKAFEVERLGLLNLKEKQIRKVEPDDFVEVVSGEIARLGLDVLPWSKELVSLRGRLQFLHRTFSEEWPDFSDDVLLASLDEWLEPFLRGISRRTQFKNISLKEALMSRIDWSLSQKLDVLAPTHYKTPGGPRIRIDYVTNDIPILPVKLQLMFGEKETPKIARGRVSLLLHLLSPARRPVQVTQDLKSFWETTYAHVRKELKGRYPKHDWPDPDHLL